jgi:hypothetical protein
MNSKNLFLQVGSQLFVPVPPDTAVSRRSRFGDSVWYMGSLVTLPGVSAESAFDFQSCPGHAGGFPLALKEFAFHRLFGGGGARDIGDSLYEPRTVEWLTVANDLNCLRQFARFCSIAGAADFSEVTLSITKSFLKRLKFLNQASGVVNEVDDSADTTLPVSPETNFDDHDGEDSECPPFSKRSTAVSERVATIFRAIYKLWEVSPYISNGLPEIPLGVSYKKIFRKRYALENRTRAIPENIYGPLTRHALDYVLCHSATILATWNDIRLIQLDFQRGGYRGGSYGRRLKKRVEQLLILRPAGWLRAGWQSHRHFAREFEQLRTACTIVVLAFSGIRASELLSIRAGSCVTDRCDDGRTRVYLNTELHKHVAGGVQDAWVVIEDVAKAVNVLEMITAPVRAASGDDRLFLSDGGRDFFRCGRAGPGTELHTLTFEGLVWQFNVFSSSCSKYVSGPEIPMTVNENGQSVKWHFDTRQFRRTLARYIARRPFGIIAGTLQYKHASVTMFEGYAGVEPEWNRLIDEERALAGIDLLEEVAIGLASGEISGKLGHELQQDFYAEFRGRAEDFSVSQIARWLADRKRPLFVGKLNFCLFSAENALCTDKSSKTPIVNACHPDQCGNSCVTKRHVPLWRAQLEQAEEMKEFCRTSLQKNIMLQEIKSLKQVLSSLESK